MKRSRIHKNRILFLMTLAAAALFAILYADSGKRTAAGTLKENKEIYKANNQIYDAYITVFPTKDDEGTVADFSSFSLITDENRDYNPILDCNVQIVKEGETPDSKTDLNCKNATIRVRGASTRVADQKSYKVKLENNAEPFFGQTNLNINKHTQDETKIAAKLQTDLLADISNIFSYRTYFMRVWIKDTSLPEAVQGFQYQGLYTEVEQPNEDYLKERGLNGNAVMYKANYFTFSPSDKLRNVDDPLYRKEEFETVLKIQSGNNHKKLLEMLTAVNDPSLDFEEVFHTYFDEDNYLTWLAFNLLMGNEDITSHNYIIFSPAHSNKWYFLPWDFDGALDFEQYKDTWNHRLSLKSVQGLYASVLHRKYLRLDGSTEKLRRKMEELLEKYITREKVTELVSYYKGILRKTLLTPPDIGQMRISPEELDDRLNNLYDGILKCYDIYNENILYPAPMFVALPEKLEDDSVRFAWDPSYSYQGLPITYKIEVYDAVMDQTVFCQENIKETSWILKDGLEPGTYFVRISAIDSKGHIQINLEHFNGQLPDGKKVNVYGLLEFEIEQ